MKATWVRDNESPDPLAAARGIVNGLLFALGFWLMVLCAWIYQRFF